MVEHSALALLIFCVIFRWIVFLDVILSWSVLFGFRVKIPFVRALLDPCYDSVRRHLPVSFSGLDFAPIILILATLVAEAAIITFVPSVTVLL